MTLRQLCERARMNVLTYEQQMAINDALPLLLEVYEIAAKRPNKMGPHYMIWMDRMDAAIAKVKEAEG